MGQPNLKDVSSDCAKTKFDKLSMNIVLIRRRFSATGGAERYLERLGNALQIRGHEVTLVCESWEGGEVPFTVRTTSTNSPASFAQAVQNLHLQDEYDVVFSLERVPGCDLYRAGDGLHCEWMRLRSIYSPITGFLRNQFNLKNGIIRKLEAELFQLKSVRRIIANANHTKEAIIRKFHYPRELIDVVYNGVSFEQFALGDRRAGRKAFNLPEDAFIVLLVGAGYERKGVKYAEEAVSRLEGWPLLLIDSPQSIPMADIYAMADVFLLPTLYDPFSNVVLEALAAGLPVITTIHNGASEIIDHGKDGFILQRADDVDVMENYLRQLMDPSERAKFRIPAQTLAQKFNLKRNVDDTLKICEKVAAERAKSV